MFEKLALKRLTTGDLTLFEWHFANHNVEDQKGIILDGTVLVDKLYPSLPIIAQEQKERVPLNIVAYGPGLEEGYELQRRIEKIPFSKNWKIAEERIRNPLNSLERFNPLETGDFAVFDFTGEPAPYAARVILVARAVPADVSLHDALDGFLAAQRMLAITTDQLRQLIIQAAPPENHPIHILTLDTDLEDAALGGIQGIRRLRTRPSSWQMGQEVLDQARKKAKRIGELGETYVDGYLRGLKEQGLIQDFEWVSRQNAIAPNDFWISDNDGTRVLIDVKSTEGNFTNPIHISYNELLQMNSGPERYDIYRVFEVGEETAHLSISKDVGDFARGIIETFNTLPAGVSPDGISVLPSLLTFQAPLLISFPEEPAEA